MGNPDVWGLKDASGRHEMDGPDAKHTNILFLLNTHNTGKLQKWEDVLVYQREGGEG